MECIPHLLDELCNGVYSPFMYEIIPHCWIRKQNKVRLWRRKLMKKLYL